MPFPKEKASGLNFKKVIKWFIVFLLDSNTCWIVYIHKGYIILIQLDKTHGHLNSSLGKN